MEDHSNLKSSKATDYGEQQNQPLQSKMDAYLKSNQNIRNKRLTKNQSFGPQSYGQRAKLGHGTSLFKLLDAGEYEENEEQIDPILEQLKRK